MSDDRIKELQDFTDDFKRKLKDAKERYENSLSRSMENKDIQRIRQSKYNNMNNSPKKIKHKHMNVNNIL